LRAYSNGRQVVFFQTNDAGALFRLTDTYPRIVGGQMWIAMDPPTADGAKQDGLMNVREFTVRGEAAHGFGQPVRRVEGEVQAEGAAVAPGGIEHAARRHAHACLQAGLEEPVGIDRNEAIFNA